MKNPLPTYETIAEVMANENGSGLRLAYWTAGRAVLMVPGLRLVDVPLGQAVAGALVASSLISTFALWRFSYVARQNGLRKDVPMKALAWLGLLGVGAAGWYWYATKDEKKEEGVEPVTSAEGPTSDDSAVIDFEDVVPGGVKLDEPPQQNIFAARKIRGVPLLTGFNRTGLRANYTGRRYRS